MTFSVRQALIDSGHFTEGPNRILVHEQAVEHAGIVGDFIARSVREALGLPPQEDS